MLRTLKERNVSKNSFKYAILTPIPQCIPLSDLLYFYLSKSKYLRQWKWSGKIRTEQVGKSRVAANLRLPIARKTGTCDLLTAVLRAASASDKALKNVFLASPSPLPPFFYCPDLLSLLQPPPTCQALLGSFFSPPVEFPRPILKRLFTYDPSFLPLAPSPHHHPPHHHP